MFSSFNHDFVAVLDSFCIICREYSRLKSKYAGDLISNWKETSDAEKSIHEDIGIAAYLTCIWGQKKISFVDLGCGNGLLGETSRELIELKHFLFENLRYMVSHITLCEEMS